MDYPEPIRSTTVHLEIMSIKRHLKERSFKAFIMWRGRVCTIRDLDIFQSIVLTTLTPKYSLDELIEVLKRHSLCIIFSEHSLIVKFPLTHPKKVSHHSCEENSPFKDIDLIEAKQKNILSCILSTQERLARAMEINLLLKVELARSKKIWDDFRGTQIGSEIETIKHFTHN